MLTIRALCLAFVLTAALGAAAIFDSAAAERAALAQLQAAQTAPPAARAAHLTNAEAILHHAWSRPLAWRPNANDALSWSYAMRAAEDARASRAQSAAAAARAVSLAPVQPRAWLRLAALDDGADACTPRACLANSWRAAPILDRDAACARLQAARTLGISLERGDPRIEGFLITHATAADIARCLSGQPPETVFAALMRQRQAFAERP